MQTVTFSVFRFDGAANRFWALTRMGAARRPLRRETGGGFSKLLGSGAGEGFTPRPNLSVYGVLATWPSLERARRRLGESEIFRGYRARAAESWTVYLRALGSRGAWDGRAPFEARPEPTRGGGPIASLTRATLRLGSARDFWRREPAISAATARCDGLLFKIGVGEAPWLRQATFTVWRDAEALDAFAAGPGPHREAARAAYERGWFRECLFARFAVLESQGSWAGGDPLRRAPAPEIAA